MSLPAKISIQFCGGWGYKRYSDALGNYLMNEFDDSELIIQPMKGIYSNIFVLFLPISSYIPVPLLSEHE